MDIALSVLILFILPMAILFVLKSNAGVMFLAACTGLVLLNNMDDVVVTTAGSVVPGEGEAYVRLAVVVLTLVFSGLVFRNTVKGTSIILHSIIVLFLGATLVLNLPEATGVSWLIDLTGNDWWQELNNYRALVITVGFALSLVAVLTNHTKHKKHHK